jgi:hypothetical protein
MISAVPRGPRALAIFTDCATENEAALPAFFFFLARSVDGGVASTLEVCVHSSLPVPLFDETMSPSSEFLAAEAA